MRVTLEESAHLRELVAALTAAGNDVLDGGFRENQGGVDCSMRLPLDFEIVEAFVANDPHDIRVNRETEEVACMHCWTSIRGARA